MKLESIRQAILVEKEDQLSDMVSDLSQQVIIGVDTESNSLFEYEERVCLIQFSTISNDYLVDSIQLSDLSNLAGIFANTRIQKVFHAAEYDLMCLKRDFSFEFNNIFDTMIASRILGKSSFGLSSLLNEYFNISVEKKYQRANWGKRPLSEEMLLYAQLDTYFLIQLRDIFLEDLIKTNKVELANEDFIRMTDVEAFINNKNHDQYWKIIKGNSLLSHQESVLMELFYLRDNLAKNSNRPPFKIFSNQNIIDIAKKSPQNISELRNIDHFSPKLINKYGEDILKAIQVGLEKKHITRKRKPKPSPEYIKKYDALKEWRKNKSNSLSVDSDIVLPKEHLEQLSHLENIKIENIQKIMENIPYRFSLFGKEILSILENKEGL